MGGFRRRAEGLRAVICAGAGAFVVAACSDRTDTSHHVVTDDFGGRDGGPGNAGGSSGSDQAGGHSGTSTSGGATGAGGSASGGARAVSGGAGGASSGGAPSGGAAGNDAGGAGTGGRIGRAGGTAAGGTASGGAASGGAGGAVTCVPATNAMEAGTWVEIAQIPCNGGAEHAPVFPIKEFILEWGGDSAGRFKVTWQPFETYVDYWGSYTLDRGTALTLKPEDGNYIPKDLDPAGFISRCGDELVLRNMWLGTQRDEASRPVPTIPGCGHRFRKRMPGE
jgi:hypothetical protein